MPKDNSTHFPAHQDTIKEVEPHDDISRLETIHQIGKSSTRP